MLPSARRSVFFGAGRSLVAHLLWEQRVGGSNPLAPTTCPVRLSRRFTPPQFDHLRRSGDTGWTRAPKSRRGRLRRGGCTCRVRLLQVAYRSSPRLLSLTLRLSLRAFPKDRIPSRPGRLAGECLALLWRLSQRAPPAECYCRRVLRFLVHALIIC